MCLLDKVMAWDDESITCLSNTHRDALNPLQRNGRLSSVHAFEYGAQAIAIHGGLQARAAGETAPPGYLAALRDARLHVQWLDDLAAPLHVRAVRLFADGANNVYQCTISTAENLLAEARVTIMLRPSTLG